MPGKFAFHSLPYPNQLLQQRVASYVAMIAVEGSAGAAGLGVRIVSRRMVRPSPSPSPSTAASSEPSGGAATASEPETVHLTPWDLQMLTVDNIQMGVLLPKPPPAAGAGVDVVERLAASFARALARFHPFAGRLAAEERGAGADGTVTVSLRCTGDGAEFVHAVAAPGVTAADVAGSLYVPRAVWSFFPLDGLVGADAAAGSRSVLAAQVTELADGGVFVAMSLNHGVADGAAFWHLFNTWSEISRSTGAGRISSPAPVVERWFPAGCPAPVPLPFAKLEHVVRRFDGPPLEECFFSFSGESIKNLKARANAETAGAAAGATATISSLQSLLAHAWRAVTRARRLPRWQETSYTVLVGCRRRVARVPDAYAGNAVVRCTARAAAGEVLDGGLGWTARLLHRAVAAQEEAALVESAAAWHRSPAFAYIAGWWHPAAVVTGNSPRFDVFGNDFGWGRPVAVRSGGANKVDGRATVYEGGDGGGSMGMELALAPDVLARLVADEEFMGTVKTAT
ncbi:hypothetical protein ACP4OV_018305 [Aristida adscensionis]